MTEADLDIVLALKVDRFARRLKSVEPSIQFSHQIRLFESEGLHFRAAFEIDLIKWKVKDLVLCCFGFDIFFFSLHQSCLIRELHSLVSDSFDFSDEVHFHFLH